MVTVFSTDAHTRDGNWVSWKAPEKGNKSTNTNSDYKVTAGETKISSSTTTLDEAVPGAVLPLLGARVAGDPEAEWGSCPCCVLAGTDSCTGWEHMDISWCPSSSTSHPASCCSLGKRWRMHQVFGTLHPWEGPGEVPSSWLWIESVPAVMDKS